LTADSTKRASGGVVSEAATSAASAVWMLLPILIKTDHSHTGGGRVDQSASGATIICRERERQHSTGTAVNHPKASRRGNLRCLGDPLANPPFYQASSGRSERERNTLDWRGRRVQHVGFRRDDIDLQLGNLMGQDAQFFDHGCPGNSLSAGARWPKFRGTERREN
jgi:hypothetical protein